MINFSKRGLKQELLDAINALPAETSSAPKDLVVAGKASAVALVNALKTNGGQVNLRVNVLNDWVQIEAQASGLNIKPKAPTAGSEATNPPQPAPAPASAPVVPALESAAPAEAPASDKPAPAASETDQPAAS